MPITEKTLRIWRSEALKVNKDFSPALYEGTAEGLATGYIKLNRRILSMTQELLDAHLLRRE